MFIPIYDGKPMRNVRYPIINWSIIAMNVLVYFVVQAPVGVENAALSLGIVPALLNDHAVLPADAEWVPSYFTYVTYAFLHGDIFHLGANMLFLWVFGDNVEDAMGHIKYVFFFLICAAIAAFCHVFLYTTAQAPLIGASGAVSGVIAAYLMLYPKARIWVLMLGKIPLPLSAFLCLGAWIAYQIFNLLYYPESQVSWISHVSGLFAGAILIPFFKFSHIRLFGRTIMPPISYPTNRE